MQGKHQRWGVCVGVEGGQGAVWARACEFKLGVFPLSLICPQRVLKEANTSEVIRNKALMYCGGPSWCSEFMELSCTAPQMLLQTEFLLGQLTLRLQNPFEVSEFWECSRTVCAFTSCWVSTQSLPIQPVSADDNSAVASGLHVPRGYAHQCPLLGLRGPIWTPRCGPPVSGNK